MALLLMEGFETFEAHTNTATPPRGIVGDGFGVSQVWTATEFAIIADDWGGKAVDLKADGLHVSIPARAELWVGFWWYNDTFDTEDEFWNGYYEKIIGFFPESAPDDPQVSLRVTNTGILDVQQGTNVQTTIATSTTPVVSTSTWHRIEFSAFISNTVGTVDVQVDGVSVISATGLDTQFSGQSSVINSIGFNYRGLGTGGIFAVDSLYVIDDVVGGSEPASTFLDSWYVETSYPVSDATLYASWCWVHKC